MTRNSEIRSEPAGFLHALFDGKPDNLFILVWVLPDKESRWFTSVEDAVHYISTLNHCDCYVGVGLSKSDNGAHHRCESKEVAGIVALWGDFDLRSPAHPKDSLPTTIDEATSILPPDLSPSFTISTGNGVHCWWILSEPWVFDDEGEREQAAKLVRRFTTFLRDSAALKGWSFDRLNDLARVLRVPGTKNWKDPAKPKDVAILSQTGQRYNPSDIEEYLDLLGVPDPAVEELASRAWAERFKDQPIVVNLGARIPEEQLNPWLQSDLRFKNTWFRQRHDLNDQSQSGYDMALACFGIDRGLSSQQIVDLMIHHRVIHNEKHRTRVDYFRCTIAKAADRSRSNASADAVIATDPVRTSAHTTPEAARIEICRRISALLGIELLRIIKIDGKEPLYRLDLEEGKVEFNSVAKLISQRDMRVALAARAGKLIPKFKTKEWEVLAQMMLDAAIVEDGGEELDYVGSARLYIEQYLVETTPIECVAGQLAQNLRRPMVRDGRITVWAREIQMHINKTTMQNLSVRAVAGMLSAIGAVKVRIREGKRDQDRWALPINEFNPAEFWPTEPEANHE